MWQGGAVQQRQSRPLEIAGHHHIHAATEVPIAFVHARRIGHHLDVVTQVVAQPIRVKRDGVPRCDARQRVHPIAQRVDLGLDQQLVVQHKFSRCSPRHRHRDGVGQADLRLEEGRGQQTQKSSTEGGESHHGSVGPPLRTTSRQPGTTTNLAFTLCNNKAPT